MKKTISFLVIIALCFSTTVASAETVLNKETKREDATAQKEEKDEVEKTSETIHNSEDNEEVTTDTTSAATDEDPISSEEENDAVSSSSEQEKTSSIEVWKGYAYATVQQNDLLEANAFVPLIEDIHNVKIKTISFSNENPSTNKIGRFDVGITFETNEGESFSGNFGYLVNNKKATIKISNVNYDIQKRKLTLTTSPNARLFIDTDSEPVTWEGLSDGQGNFETTLSSSPTKITIFAMDDNGNFSETFNLNLPKKNKMKVPLYSVGFDKETRTLSGTTLPNIDVKVSTEKGTVTNQDNPLDKQLFRSDAKTGEFNVVFDFIPKMIKMELTDHEGLTEIYYLSTDENDEKTIIDVAQDAKKLPQTNERGSMFIGVTGALIVLITGIVIYRKKQNVNKTM